MHTMLHSWQVDPARVQVTLQADGQPYKLYSGSFGTVSFVFAAATGAIGPAW